MWTMYVKFCVLNVVNLCMYVHVYMHPKIVHLYIFIKYNVHYYIVCIYIISGKASQITSLLGDPYQQEICNLIPCIDISSMVSRYVISSESYCTLL